MNIEENEFYTEINGVFGDNLDFTFMNHGYFPIDDRLIDSDLLFKTSGTLYLRLMSFIDQQKINSLLEIGSGRGGGISLVKGYHNIQDCHAIDYNQENIDFCRKNLRKDIQFKQGNGLELEFPDNRFDVVINVESSHCYLDRYDDFFKEVLRVMKDDGTFLYTDVYNSEKLANSVYDTVRQNFEIIYKEDSTYNAHLSCLEMSRALASIKSEPYGWYRALFEEKAEVYRQRLGVFKFYVLRKIKDSK